MEFLLFLGGCYIVYVLFFKQQKNSKPMSNYPQKVKDEWGNFKVEASSQRSRSQNEQSTNEELDDDLATFTISYGYEEEVSKNKTLGRWISPGESVVVHGRKITNGNFYFGGQLSSLDGYGTEASLIDDSLQVSSISTLDSHTLEDDSLGYWPKYISLSARCRGVYLDWLASDRSKPDMPIGYIFIYFYGLERRVVVDAAQGNVEDFEYISLFDELQRLRAIYSHNRSFFNYSTRLLELMCLTQPDIVSLQEDEFSPGSDSLLFKYHLATTVHDEEPIPAEMALAWVKFYPEYNLRTPARRCDVEFAKLFKSKYTETFGEGLVVKPNKTRLKLEYWPASSSIRGVKIEQQDLPDPSVLKTPVKKLITIADSCTSELDAYSRYLGKKGTSKNDVAAVMLLPDELANAESSSVIGGFKDWADKSISANKGLVTVADFWAHTGTPLPAKINKKETELIQSLAQKAGFGIAPDSRYHNAKLTLDGKVVLFIGGHGDFFEPSKAFNEVGMALRLGSMVANIDSDVDESELNVLHQLIAHNTKLSPTEKSSLNAYLTWRLNTPANMIGLKARLEKLGDKEKAAVSHILIGVSLADGKIDPTEIKQLEKLYTALGLDKSLVTSDIHRFSSSKTSTQVSPISTSPVKSTVQDQDKPSFELDENILALHESETNDVQTMLGAIFVDEEPEPQNEKQVKSSSGQSAGGLEASHHELYQSLISKEKWARKEVAELCQKLDLMIDGAIETINDWSFDMVDAPVLDDDDDIYVDLEVVEELEG
ncbi:tellurite resistance TerB family protein [Photobacterium sp. J15]|uniref:tellurite resistance TerB family protein n=1 Tax=Photobacterium sp. J15 TaxID=265901 RepID=UPI0007E4C8BC|nr:TerB N-terminal domain-containing protein [Photobacterium sp. J15]